MPRQRIFGSGVDIPILCYHQIGKKEDTRFPTIYLSVKKFEQEIAWLLRLGYQFLALADLVILVEKGEKPKRRSVVITFDDGYDGVYQNAFPILQRYSCPATVFVIAQRLTNKENITSFPFLTTLQLREMTQYGIQVGSHSFTHTDLVSLKTPKALETEIFDSKREIEERIGQEVQDFCYPYGHFDELVVAAVKGAGYRSACSTIFGKRHSQDSLFRLSRVPVGYKHTILQFLYHVAC